MARKRSNRRKKSNKKTKRGSRSSTTSSATSKTTEAVESAQIAPVDESNVAVKEECQNLNEVESTSAKKSSSTSRKKKTSRNSKKAKPKTTKINSVESRQSEDVEELIDNVDSLVDELEKDATPEADVSSNSSEPEDDSDTAESQAKVTMTIALDDEEELDADDEFEREFERELAKEEQQGSKVVDPEVEVKKLDTSNHADILARLDKVTVDVDSPEFDLLDDGEEVVVSSVEPLSAATFMDSDELDEPIQSASAVLTQADADAMLERFELTAHRMVTLLNEKMNTTIERWSVELGMRMKDGDQAESTLGWEERREQLMKDYGFEDGDATQNGLNVGNEIKDLDVPVFADASEDEEELNEIPETNLVDTLDSLDETQSEMIAELKADLTSKLREAEIELSINRAKLSQLRASLDAKQVEIDRRESRLRQKYIEMESARNKTGFFDRWSRHLTFRKKKKISDLETSWLNLEEDSESTPE
jgi:hypothetical protein